METLYELCKTNIWSKISVAQYIVFLSKQKKTLLNALILQCLF